MVAIVAGNGLGLLNTSLNTCRRRRCTRRKRLLGQGSNRAVVNAANGNLVLQSQDAQLAGRGTDLFALRTYNSLGTPTDGDEDGWRWGYEQTVRFQGPGSPLLPDAGATVVAYRWRRPRDRLCLGCRPRRAMSPPKAAARTTS